MTGIKLKTSLFLLRVSIFIVMLFWTIDKLMHPSHAAKIFNDYYFLLNSSNVMINNFVTVIEFLLVCGFGLGFCKTLTYGSMLFFQSISVISSIDLFLKPFYKSNLIFFSNLPMLAACIMLFLLKRNDKFLSL